MPAQNQPEECATKQSCTRDFDGPLQVCWGEEVKIVNIGLALYTKAHYGFEEKVLRSLGGKPAWNL